MPEALALPGLLGNDKCLYKNEELDCGNGGKSLNIVAISREVLVEIVSFEIF